jgi:hypothetical protein
MVNRTPWVIWEVLRLREKGGGDRRLFASFISVLPETATGQDAIK